MEENKNEEVKVENNFQNVENSNNCNCKDNCSCKKNRKGIPVLLTVLLCLIAGGLGTFLGNKVFNMTEKKNEEKAEEKSNSNENSNSNEQKKEENINELNEELKNEMINKVATLLGGKEYKKGTQINASIAFGGVFEEIVNGKFSEEDKTLMILGSVVPDKDGNFSGEEFAKNYKYVYGVEPKYVSTGCPAYKYDKTKKMYVDGEGGCGGASASSDFVYVDDVVKTSDNVLSIQVYVGSEYSSYAGEEDIHLYFSDYFTYSYWDGDNLVKSAPVTKETKITEQNKTQFTKYIFNFEKSTDGNYYYKNVEKAK